jgi:uncharacterized membrane protein YfcA
MTAGMQTDQLIVMAVALGAGGLVKGATGMGLPLVAVPILASFLGVQHAVAVMTVPIVATNAWQVWRFRAERRGADFLPGLLAGGVVGVVIGTWLIVSAPEKLLAQTMAAVLFTYVALRLVHPHLALPRQAGRRLGVPVGIGAGALQGATGVGSPLGVTYIHAMRLPRGAHVFAVSAMFLQFGVVQIPALAVAGVLTWPILLQGALAMLPALAALPVGGWLAGWLPPRAFDIVILVLLVLVAVQLLATSLGG